MSNSWKMSTLAPAYALLILFGMAVAIGATLVLLKMVIWP